jgi:hypothetical protein
MTENTPPAADGQNPAQVVDTPQPHAEETFTKDAVTRLIKGEVAKVVAKYKPFQEKAEQYDKLLESQKSDQEKLAEKLAAAEKARLDAELRIQELVLLEKKRDAVIKAGLGIEWADAVIGDTDEEIDSRIATLKSRLDGIARPQKQVAAVHPPAPIVTSGKLTREDVRRMSPKEYEARRDEIFAAMAKGEIK